jgi:hypothetical protein
VRIAMTVDAIEDALPNGFIEKNGTVLVKNVIGIAPKLGWIQDDELVPDHSWQDPWCDQSNQKSSCRFQNYSSESQTEYVIFKFSILRSAPDFRKNRTRLLQQEFRIG